MRFLLVVLGLLAVPLAWGDEAIPAKTLSDIKGATAFIKLQAGPLRATGSGFLIRAAGTTGYLVTNHHVIHIDAPGLPKPVVTVVFWSGTKQEKVYPAEVVASDKSRDLAVLKVEDARELPAPLDLAPKVELVETLPVFIFGFPFGQALSLTRGHPAMTVGKGTVSSIRRNDLDQVAMVQIDGDLNPGNSGGPVVDGKGRLVGVAVARLRGTRIGLAIPSGELQAMLNGRVSGISTRWNRLSDTEVELQITLSLIDPLRKMRAAEVLYLPAGSLKEKPKPDKESLWTAIAGAEKVVLKIEGAVARGAVKLNSREKGRVLYALQTVFVEAEGRKLLTAVTEHPVEFGEATVIRPPMKLDNPPPVVLKDRTTQVLPGTVADVVVGGGGRYLILHVADKRKLVVWDVYLSKVAKELALAADHVKIAASADKLLVLLPGQKLIQRYSLKTFERETTVPLRIQGEIKGMAMGSASSGPLALSVLNDRGAELPEFMDPLTLKSFEVEWPGGKVPGTTGEFLRASANGQVFAARQGVGSEPHSCIVLFVQGRAVKPVEVWMPGSLPLPTADGQHVCTETAVFGRDLKRVLPRMPTNIGLYPFLPGQQGPWFMRFEAGEPDSGKLALFVPGHERPFATLSQIEGYLRAVIPYGKLPNPLMHDKRVFLVPEAKVLITLPQSNDRLVIRPLDLDKMLEKAPFDLLFVASQPIVVARAGTHYTYQVGAKSNKGGVKYKLESGPAGMKISAQGLLEWDVPARVEKADQDVVIAITDAAGQECFHAFALTVEK